MRCFATLLVLVFAFLGSLDAELPGPAAAQREDEPKEPPDEAATLATPEKLTLILDPGGHTAAIEKVFFTPDSKQLLTLGMDHCIRVWDVETGEAVKTLYPPGFGGLSAAALSPNGKRLALASVYQEGETPRHLVYLLTLPDGRVERVFKGHTATIKALAFSGDGKRLASSSQNGTTYIWNPDRDEHEKVLHKQKYYYRLALSPDGSRLAGLDKVKSGVILNLGTGQVVARIEGHSCLAWSPDGKTLATGSLEGLQLWDADGKLRSRKLDGRHIFWIGFSQDSRSLLAAGGGAKSNLRATLLDAATGTELKESQPKGIKHYAANDGALSPDGRFAATGGGGAGGHEVFIWRMEEGAVPTRLAARSWIPGTHFTGAWSADGKAISWSDFPNKANPSFHLGDLQFGPPIPEKEARWGAWRRDGLALEKISNVGALKVLKDGKPVARLVLESVNDATLVGKDQAAVAGKFGRFWLFDANTGKVLRRFVPTKVRSLAPSPDGRFLLTVSTFDQTLRIWSLERDKPLLSLYVHGQDWVIWTPEGYYAATPGGERLIGWKVDNGIRQMPTYYPAERFRKVLYRPDVIKLVLETGSVAEALKAADAARGQATRQLDLEQVLPPRAALEVLNSAPPQFRLRAQATASGKAQPVTALRLLVDGRPLPEGAGHAMFKGQVQADVTWAVTLPPGKHSLAVLARSPDASSISAAVEVTCPEPARQAALRVLAVGINDYRKPIPKLAFAAADARAIADAFSKNCKGDLFHEVAAKALLDEEASRPAVLAELAKLRKAADANDLVVVYFAGHGIKEKDKFYLLTVEANPEDLAKTALSGEDLRKALAEFPCQVLLMLDACHSAAGLKNFRSAVDEVTRTLTEDECGVAVLCAAMAHEKALEKGGNGLFTRAVVQALGQAEGVPFNHRDRRQYVHHLHSFVFDEVKGASNDRQHPFLCLPWVVESFALRQLRLQSSGQP